MRLRAADVQHCRQAGIVCAERRTPMATTVPPGDASPGGAVGGTADSSLISGPLVAPLDHCWVVRLVHPTGAGPTLDKAVDLAQETIQVMVDQFGAGQPPVAVRALLQRAGVVGQNGLVTDAYRQYAANLDQYLGDMRQRDA